MTRELVDLVDAEFERAVFVAMLGEWIESHVPRLFNHMFGEAIGITNGWLVICDFEGHMPCMDELEWAIVRAVAGFSTFVAYRGFHSRAVVSVVALRFESAFAIGALVFWTLEAFSAFVSRAAAFAAFGLIAFGCRVS